LLASCDAVLRLEDIHPPPPVLTYRKAILITSDTLLDDIPVSVALDADPELAAHARPDGSDVLFDDGTNVLPCEIVAYDAGTLDAWVRLPELLPGTTTIYLDYGGATRTGDRAAAWPASYIGVWHQAETGATAFDSTVHGHDLVAEVTLPTSVSGVVGGARGYSAPQQMCAADPDNSLEFDATSSFAYSVWAYLELPPPSYNIALYKGGASVGDVGFDLELGAAWVAYLADAIGPGASVASSNTPPMNRWAQEVIVVDRGNATVLAYLDGSQVNSSGIAGLGSLASGTEICLGGASGGGTNGYFGRLDEARVVSGVPSDARIRFEHANLAARDHVISIGPEEVIR
jgi:hypothetical protein